MARGPRRRAQDEGQPYGIYLMAAARPIHDADKRADGSSFDDERAIVLKAFAVEHPRAKENLHCAATRRLAARANANAAAFSARAASSDASLRALARGGVCSSVAGRWRKTAGVRGEAPRR